MKIKEVYNMNNTANESKANSMQWKTKVEEDVTTEKNSNQEPRCLIDTIRCMTSCYLSTEVQEIFIGFLLMVGLWTTTKWMLSVIFSLIWPLLLVTGVVLAIPTWRDYITDEYLPENILDPLFKKFTNSTSTMVFSAESSFE